MRRSLHLLAVLTACGAAQTMRNVTYPPDFRYLDETALHDAMGRLAKDVIAIDRTLRGAADIDPPAQAQVIGLLTDIQTTVRGLAERGASTNHPLIDKNLGAFAADVERALFEAQLSPPRYYLAGSLTGSCMHCHNRPVR